MVDLIRKSTKYTDIFTNSFSYVTIEARNRIDSRTLEPQNFTYSKIEENLRIFSWESYNLKLNCTDWVNNYQKHPMKSSYRKFKKSIRFRIRAITITRKESKNETGTKGKSSPRREEGHLRQLDPKPATISGRGSSARPSAASRSSAGRPWSSPCTHLCSGAISEKGQLSVNCRLVKRSNMGRRLWGNSIDISWRIPRWRHGSAALVDVKAMGGVGCLRVLRRITAVVHFTFILSSKYGL